MEKIKLTIIIEGIGKQEIYLLEEDAITIYAEAGQGVANKLMESLHPVKVSSVGFHGTTGMTEGPLTGRGRGIQIDMENNPEPIKTYDLEKNLAFYNAKGIADPKVISEKQLEAIPVFGGELNPFTSDFFKNEKLIAYRCPECGKVTVRKLTLGDSNETTCHWCKEDVVIKDVALAEMGCASCDNKGWYYVANGLTELDCHKCHAPIDIVYYMDGKIKRAKAAHLAN